LWLISKDVLPEGTDIKTAQHTIEKHLKATEAEEFFHGARKEIEDWSPKSWPQVAKAYSPILAPPPIDAPPVMEDAKGAAKKVEAPVKAEPAKGKAPPAVAGKKK
jgi:hypothetical protein